MSATEALCDIAAGSVGGFLAKLLDYPLDTVKVLLQTQHQSTAAAAAPGASSAATTTRYNGALDCLQQAIRQHGVSSLYRGITSPLLGSMAENAICFFAYANIKRLLLLRHADNDTQKQQGGEKNELTLFELCMAGAGAGVAVSFVLTPVELIKCRMQVSAQMDVPLYKGPWDVVSQALRKDGLRGLYTGHLSTMYREIPGNFCWYGTYEIVCQGLSNWFDIPRKELPLWAHMTGGASAGVMYWTAFYPADTVKSLVQTSTCPEFSQLSFGQACKRVYLEQGLKGLYRGWGITAIRAAPAHALIFAGYEQTLHLLRPAMMPKDDVHFYD